MYLTEWAMLGLQIGATIQSLYARNWWRALYWAGALILTIAVVKGMKR